MERRDFLKKSATVGALAIVSPSLLVQEGCAVNVQALLNTVISATEAVLKVAEPSAPWLQPLESALAALIQAEGQWQSGSAVQILISALNTIQAVLAVIPVTAVYSPLIAVLVAGIEAVLSALYPQAPAQTPVSAARAQNPYLGAPHAAKLHGRSLLHPTYQSAFRAQWNEAARKANLNAALI